MLAGHSTEEARKLMAKDLPLGAVATPDDQAEAVLFLVSKRSAMVTGHTLDVDSGQQLGWGGNYLEDIERRRKGDPGGK
jgi:NAD(P)-dependent dehydrogenase (short-subunit alcohol dehydrogenase family)